ncbi:MAG: hypothetical protein LT067_07955 [Sulfurovum sp.]|nr:hypothetical protein [Sulfurovum sp.]
MQNYIQIRKIIAIILYERVENGAFMSNTKLKLLLLSSFLSALFVGCTPAKTPQSQGGYYHNGIYFGKNLSKSFQHGIQDGCTTARGDYQKSHTLFNTDKSYHDGWFLGRNKCRLD